jgi:hypothetical protein
MVGAVVISNSCKHLFATADIGSRAEQPGPRIVGIADVNVVIIPHFDLERIIPIRASRAGPNSKGAQSGLKAAVAWPKALEMSGFRTKTPSVVKRVPPAVEPWPPSSKT